MLRSVVKGIGAYLPAQVVTNADLEKRVNTNDAWIIERTGIKQRHIAAEGEFTSHLGAKAGLAALKNAGLAPDDIDLLVVATGTPDNTLPATGPEIQHQLGMTRGAAFDVNAACSGFVYALDVADSFIQAGKARRVLVLGADTYSRILDWNDRSTCILFGDGAGGFVLEGAQGKGSKDDRGILHTRIYSDGQFTPLLTTSGGVSSTKTAGFVTMAGKEVFRHAVAKMADAIEEGLSALGFRQADLDWIVPHQANARIMQGVAKRLGFPEEKVISSVDRHANTSAASIPLAVAQGVAEGKIKPGHLLGLPALGGGFAWGACILRW